jgi:hypothetical protein
MRERARNSLVTLPLDAPIWERTFTVNPLVLIGTEEGASAHARHEFAYADAMVERCALLVLLLMEPPIEDAAA